MVELVIDPAIRMWVILPIVFITLVFGLIRHYVTVLLRNDNQNPSQDDIKDRQALMRSRALRENGGWIPREAFLVRKHFFNDEETGYLKQERAAANPMQAMGDPNMAFEMMKGTFTNVLPMIVIGGWINWTFAGFITTKVPFPLTLRFKSMLQRGIELKTLSASWVSSMSWYFLNVFGLRSIYGLILGAENAADQTRQMAQQMSMQGGGQAMGGKPPNMSQMFKDEWEALQVCHHEDKLAGVEREVTEHGKLLNIPLTDPTLKKLH